MLLEYKDLVYLAFFGIAMYFHGSSRFRSGMKAGIEAGVSGTVDAMIADGLVDKDDEGNIVPKKF